MSILVFLSKFYLQEARLLGADVVQRDVRVVCVLTHHHGVSLTERASPDVLPAYSNIKTCNAKYV